MKDKEYLEAAANRVVHQAADIPLLAGIPLDPDLADFMGAFEESALTLIDFIDDHLLHFHKNGEVSFDG